ncbi:calreticulin-3 [Macaca nemestrina]|uniref:Calreticulin n=3 Tax=Macaca TaxID=9539 RepID=A0A8J8XT33_MACMU|nr:calreticulin-3 [Macaca mulatta]XP_045235105.1 calreticulin-3 [Macaca fascicularis]EHH29769.1 Calreticulin-2 [Macaca mulatta]EHH59326.1 Calreticulin-2 [Macaca fascicularis]
MAGVRVPLWGICMLRVALATVYFQEEFLDGEHWRNRWVQSTNDSRFGHFRLSSGKFYGHKEKDKGLQTTQNGRFYAISARFKPFSNKGKTLVIQYTVKHEQKMDCGGGYIKVFPADVDQKNLNGKSQYYIMFGPDICGFDIKKVHVILHFKNQYHENKKLIRCKVDGFTHLYTLILRPDLSYDVKIDGQSIESGSIEYDWNLTSLKKETSPAESKDWEQTKDNKAQDWEKHFLDASASKQSDWNGELDGDWPASMLQKPPYQDGLKPEGIDKDIWLHHKMKNTNYLTQYDLSEFENIGAIGLELWQVRSGTIFDNFLITDDEEYADNFGKATWGETKGPEREMDAIQAKEEMKKAREEEEEELLSGKMNGREHYFNRFHRRNEL